MKITHSKGASGSLFGVQFVDGVGYTDDAEVIERLARQGHKVEPNLDDTQEFPAIGETGPELREFPDGVEVLDPRATREILGD